jgi:glycosyltransferase involved in cell wall biosynthesis
MNSPPRVSIVLTRYREPNWLLFETLASLACQQSVNAEVLLLDQLDDSETRSYARSLSSKSIVFKCSPISEMGLSFARNQGLKLAENNIVLFIDADAIADCTWALNLYLSLTHRDVAVAGSRIVPKWLSRPLFIARSRIIQDQYSIFDLGETVLDIHRVVGAGFGVNKEASGEQCYFDEAFGRREGRLLGGEESDLCRRVRSKGRRIQYVGTSLVIHQIPMERIQYRWIARRLMYAGLSKALVGGTPQPTHDLSLWDYVVLPLILPMYGFGYVTGRWLQLKGGAK